MTISALQFSRARMLALLLVAVFSIGAVGATVLATDASAATKKSKKCKKGFTKVKGKCRRAKGPKKGKAFVASLSSTTASPEATAAKKKKCKKGYKRTNGKGKCKKKKAATSTKVSSVSLTITDKSIYFYKFKGEVITKTPLTSIPVKVTATKGTFDVSSQVTATGDGISTTLTFSGMVKNPITYPGLSRGDSKKPTKLTAVADGISSPAVQP